MIVSASYRTDVPTFYGKWFMNRLRAGYCKVTNPYGGQVSTVSLAEEDVDGFVFWTKNMGPFMKFLPEVRERGFPFLVTYTITGYPRQFERSVVNADRSVEHMRRICGEYGPRVCVWRYDTIVLSSLTPLDFHLRNFERLSRNLAGATDEVVVSFAHYYKKTIRNMSLAAQRDPFTWEDPEADEKRRIASRLAEIARSKGMRFSICAQREYLIPAAEDAKCIDAGRMSDVAGRRIEAGSTGHRKHCGCCESRDIGAYDTCPHGCVYCYAVNRRELAQRRFREHDPEGEFLVSS